MPRRFLRRTAEGGGQVGPTPHHSIGLDTVAWLETGNGTSGARRFPMPGIGSGNTTYVALWAQIHSKGVSFPVVFDLGDTASAATDMMGFQYDTTNDRWSAFQSTGTVYTSLNTGFAAVLDTWYFFLIGYQPTAITMTSWDLAHQIESISVGAVQPGFNPAFIPTLGVGAGAGGARPFPGKIDSFAIYPNVGSAPSGLWNSGKALDFKEASGAQAAGSKIWADFNDFTGSKTWVDATGTGNLTGKSTLSHLTRQTGAGF